MSVVETRNGTLAELKLVTPSNYEARWTYLTEDALKNILKSPKLDSIKIAFPQKVEFLFRTKMPTAPQLNFSFFSFGRSLVIL